MKSIVTQETSICFICGRVSEGEHHLVFGTAGRELSEKDGLKCPICNNCHNMGEITRRIHGNSMAEKLSKMMGQLAWEKQYYLNFRNKMNGIDLGDPAREEFRKRYGRSYL